MSRAQGEIRADGVPRSRLLGGILASLAAAAAGLAFWPVLQAEFVNLDDVQLFVANTAYQGLDLPRLRWMFSTTRMGHYAPLAWLSAAIDFQAFGLDPHAFHRTSLLLHALAAVLFFHLSTRLLGLGSPERAHVHPLALRISAFVATLLFAVHPLRVESVAWATERRGLLAAVFLLGALLCWLRSVGPGRSALVSRKAYATSMVLLAASLLSKGLGMSFVAIVVVLDFWPLARLPARLRDLWERPYRAVWVQKLLPFSLCCASAVVSGWAARSATDTLLTLEAWSPLARLAQCGYGLAFYLRKTLLPTGLAPVHEIPAAFDPAEPRFLAGFAVAALFLPLVLAVRGRAPWLAAALACYALALAPVLGISQAGPQLVAERYSYVACMPFAILAGAGFLKLWDRDDAASAPLVCTCAGLVALGLVAVLSVLSWRQTRSWHDSRTLWTSAIAAGEVSSIAHNNLGALDGAAGEYELARDHFETSLAIRPDQGNAWFNLGVIHVFEKRYPEAEKAFLAARRTMTPAWDPLDSLGDLYLNHMDRTDDAIAAYRAAVADVEALGHEYFSPFPYLGLGVALARKGAVDEARPLLQFAARFPDTRVAAIQALAR